MTSSDWKHMCATYDYGTNTPTMYFDGAVLSLFATETRGTTTGSSGLYIGGTDAATDSGISLVSNCAILLFIHVQDSITFFTRVINATEVATLRANQNICCGRYVTHHKYNSC